MLKISLNNLLCNNNDNVNIQSYIKVLVNFGFLSIRTSGVLEHKWRASLKTILFLYE